MNKNAPKIPPWRLAQAIYRLARIAKNPNRLDDVFKMSDAIATEALLDAAVAALREDPEVARAIDARPRVHVNLAELRRLPKGTLGNAYARHMDAAGLDPAALPALSARTDGEYFRAHLYETHDIWHVVTGFNVDVPGEIGLQAFYLAQLPGGGLPALILAAGFVHGAVFNDEVLFPMMDEVARGYRVGRQAKAFFGVRWDDLWAEPLADVRRLLGVAEEDARAGGVLALAA